MKSLAPTLLPPHIETTLTVLTGADKGTVYRLVSSRISIGRTSDNDIVITDDSKVSRQHAEIRLSQSGFEIHLLSEKNSLTVNGKESTRAELQDNSTFILGSTQFKFSIRAKAAPTPNLMSTHLNKNISEATTVQPKRRVPNGKSKPVRYVVVGVAVLLAWMIFDTPDIAKKAAVKIRTDDLVNAEIQDAQALKAKAVAARQGGNPNDVAYRQAQQAYISGFRDYKKGQYERAQNSFQACLSLYPQHVLCNRYSRLAQRKNSELIQYHMVLGRKYRDQNQFAACRSSYRNVMVMVKDPSSSIYKEAKANYEACDAFLQGHF